MSKRLKKHAALLRFLGKAKPAISKSVIKSADRELLNTFCECSLNVLNGTVPLTTKQRSRLKKHKAKLRSLVAKRVSNKRKLALLQNGGFLSALLSPIIGILGGLLGN